MNKTMQAMDVGVSRVLTLEELVSKAAAAHPRTHPAPMVLDCAKQPPSEQLRHEFRSELTSQASSPERSNLRDSCYNSSEEEGLEEDTVVPAQDERPVEAVVTGLAMSRSLSPRRPCADAPTRKRPSCARRSSVDADAPVATNPSAWKQRTSRSQSVDAVPMPEAAPRQENVSIIDTVECAMRHAQQLQGRLELYEASLRSIEEAESRSTLQAIICMPGGMMERIQYESKAEVQQHGASLRALKSGLETRIKQLLAP